MDSIEPVAATGAVATPSRSAALADSVSCLRPLSCSSMVMASAAGAGGVAAAHPPSTSPTTMRPTKNRSISLHHVPSYAAVGSKAGGSLNRLSVSDSGLGPEVR